MRRNRLTVLLYLAAAIVIGIILSVAHAATVAFVAVYAVFGACGAVIATRARNL